MLRSSRHIADPLQKHFATLSSEYEKQDKIPEPHERVLRQAETLDAMIKTKDQLRQKVAAATPKPYQHRATTLFNFMKDRIRVNLKGEVYKDDGEAIEGSNIVDLVQHAVRDRRRQITPVGWDLFKDYLKDENAPKSLMNYDTLEELGATDLKRRESRSRVRMPRHPLVRVPAKKGTDGDGYIEPKLAKKEADLELGMGLRKPSERRKPDKYLNV